MIATPDPATLPEAATWYLATTLPLAEADLPDVVRLYGLRMWVEQAYKQVKGSLGWSQYQVRRDVAMRRHWALVQCAFAFCWWADGQWAPGGTPRGDGTQTPAAAAQTPGERGGKGAAAGGGRDGAALALLAGGAAAGAGLAGAGAVPLALLAGLVGPSPPPPLQAMLDWLLAGYPLTLYETS